MSIEEDIQESRSDYAAGSAHIPGLGLPDRSEPSAFLNFVPNLALSSEAESAIYHALVSLIRDHPDIVDDLQDKTVYFLESFGANDFDDFAANQIVTSLVPSSDGSPSGFIDKYVHASPIALAISRSLSFVEDNHAFWLLLLFIEMALKEWQNQSPEVTQSAKRMIQALISEGFEEPVEPKMQHNTRNLFSNKIVEESRIVSKLMGANVACSEQ
ncbi:hypothetical protein BLNAU_21112 [Blattamonas nauphoetae]|uniref:Uncharacterized protein n=1 Tax=Blattamonas nauphoetae TaxID=2049346 RepID=A0ABQ9WWT4_9EUKA|nr:hypothetical protein BLNAU_21112 [Blattamonas nauphoetae]